MMGAAAAGDQPSMLAAMSAMSAADRVVDPAGGAVAAYHDAKYRVFHRMYEHQMAYREIMAAEGVGP
jgi:ribulose kinase